MYDSVQIANLPKAIPTDSDLLIIQKQGTSSYTASTSAKDIKEYVKTSITSEIAAKTYYADEVTLTLDTITNKFSIKPNGIDYDQLSTRLQGLITGTETILEGTYKNASSYTSPVTCIGEFIEVQVVRSSSVTSTYALPLYRIPNVTY